MGDADATAVKKKGGSPQRHREHREHREDLQDRKE